MSILITGGAGYIGSHTADVLLESKEDLIILDNLEKGHSEALSGGLFYCGDLRDDYIIDKVFKENQIEAVIHFAAYSLVGDSVKKPLQYYDNNVGSTFKLLEKMKEYNVKNIVFSSTAAVYGEPDNIPIKEDAKTLPTNPYGETKLMVEKALKWFDNAYGIKFVSLRYFNAAGAHPSGKIGEDHDPETHLIPLILQTALGKNEKIQIFGEDYNTPDGTCIRDYIHVVDLANAHQLALEKLRNGGESAIYNLGNGTGFSVKEIINAVEDVTGKKIKREVSPRRAGDPAVLIAASEKITQELGWRPKFSSINEIVENAWRWHNNFPNGYKKKAKN